MRHHFASSPKRVDPGRQVNMPNIEIKAACPDLKRAREIAEQIRTECLGTLHQVDTYFRTPNGRLKLREIVPGAAYLIPYVKTYERQPSKSDYALLPVENPNETKRILGQLLGVASVVEKKREVFIVGNVRIHLDDVKGLGSFIEFEAVYSVDTEESRQLERRKIEELMKTFNLSTEDLITQGYVDLLAR